MLGLGNEKRSIQHRHQTLLSARRSQSTLRAMKRTQRAPGHTRTQLAIHMLLQKAAPETDDQLLAYLEQTK